MGTNPYCFWALSDGPLRIYFKGRSIKLVVNFDVIHHFEGIVKGYEMVYDIKGLGPPLKGQEGVKGQKVLNGKWDIVGKV